MKLRTRLLLTTAALGFPLLLAFGWFQLFLAERAREDALSHFVLTYMHSGGKERCDAAPASWKGGPRVSAKLPRETQLYGYTADLVSHNPAAPKIEVSLKEELLSGKSHAQRRVSDGDQEVLEVLVRMPWAEGPCAMILARQNQPPPSDNFPRFFPPFGVWLLPVVVFLLALLIAAGPLVARVRQLTLEVRQSARTRYQPGPAIHGNDEVGELARAFKDAGREIHEQMELQEQREKRLREFLDNTTHDVMIPLTVLQGHLVELQDRLSETPEGTTLSSAMGEAHYMASLIHNLSVAAKIDAGEPTVQSDFVDLRRIVERCVARHIPIARRRQIAVEHAVPEETLGVEGDLTLIEQALSNVVYNAVRYNRPGGHVAVTLERQGQKQFLLRVIDDGPGIPEEEMSKLVDRHYRGNAARTRAPDGRGIGLNIAFRVTQLHSWDLRLSRSSFGGLQVDFEGPTASS